MSDSEQFLEMEIMKFFTLERFQSDPLTSKGAATRAWNCLGRARIHPDRNSIRLFIEDYPLERLYRVENTGKASVDAVTRSLQTVGLSLRTHWN